MTILRYLVALLLVAMYASLVPVWAADSEVNQLLTLGDYAKSPAALEAAPVGVPAADIARNADQLTHQFNMHRESNKVYEVGILSGLALAILFLTLRVLSRQHADPGPHIVNATGLVCIVFGTMLLVLMAQSDQQLTAAMGILGAIAGYLFRSMRDDSQSRRPGASGPAIDAPSGPSSGSGS